MIETDIDIKNLQHCLLIIAKEIKRICEKNNIPYFMVAGTLLGAVRHQGFIPWDDDMDFGMLRDDYNKFLKICETELDKEHFFLQIIDTDPEYGKFYAKILLNDTFLNYNSIIKNKARKGFFVDVFPYDSIPDSKLLQKKQSVVTTFAMRLLREKLNYTIPCNSLGGKIEILFKGFFTKKALIRLYENEMQRYNKNKNSTYICCSNAGNGYPKETLKREWISNLKLMKFEDTEFPGSVLYDSYLTYFYGDYMTPPPEEKRNSHEFTEADFGPYKLKKV